MVYCPPLKTYSSDFNASLATEIENGQNDAVIVKALGDYAVLRDQVRACDKERTR